MTEPIDFKTIARTGLWDKNPALAQLLGLCPLLAVSGSVVNALGLGLATLLVLVGSNITVSLARNQVPDAIRLPVFVLVIAGFTTCAELLMQAYAYALYQILGIFIPLIVTNCAILGRADAFASKHGVWASAADGLAMGSGFAAVLIVLGALREALGQGTLFANMELLVPGTAHWQITLVDNYRGFLLAVLPPGAFIGLGLLVALKNSIDRQIDLRRKARGPAATPGSRRVRVTGPL
ncbi:MAG: electron transport complex subunit E [Pseudomonadota bacterium]|nr:electron transport complex subunit E [Pseudomonadota bacterium]